MENCKTVQQYIRNNRPVEPVFFLRTKPVSIAAKWFLRNFKGRVLYAIKANPSPIIIKTIYEAGIRDFDVTSLSEIERVHTLKGSTLYFMNPVKGLHDIRTAYFKYGVKDFALDCTEELEKILAITNHAKDLNLYIRIAVSNKFSKLPLENKFGVSGRRAIHLLKEARKVSHKLGICFHIGSQAMQPSAYSIAINKAFDLIEKSKTSIDTIDIGGGFPAIYQNAVPPSLDSYLEIIHKTIQTKAPDQNCEILCEPGRALVAESGSLLVQVNLKKGKFLYITEGSYGALFDAAHLDFIYPVKMHTMRRKVISDVIPFSLYGPTCDSKDFLPGPFMIPSNVEIGDYLEIGLIGAYGLTMRTRFNGFYSNKLVQVFDDPMLTMYFNGSRKSETTLISVSA
jgi:ornithine decarboxylase|tara:strand:- start:88 stop:1278 length:1191 start_codon:yes stop_codon:yes gene_type:complete